MVRARACALHVSKVFRPGCTVAQLAEMFKRPRVLPEAGYAPPSSKLPAHGLAATDEAAALRAQLAALDSEAAEV